MFDYIYFEVVWYFFLVETPTVCLSVCPKLYIPVRYTATTTSIYTYIYTDAKVRVLKAREGKGDVFVAAYTHQKNVFITNTRGGRERE